MKTSLDFSKPIITRKGNKVRILCTDMKDINPIVAIISDKNGNEYLQNYKIHGHFS